MILRDYQKMAVNAAIDWMKKHLEPAVLELCTGAGKSLIIAHIAKWIHEEKKKKTLVLAPSKELVEQDYDKFLTTGHPASIYSASIKKCLRHNIVFGTPTSVYNAIDKFGAQFACVIIDEGDGITPTVKKIIYKMQEDNPRLRVIGLTATPYRLNTGYIYEIDENDRFLDESESINPFYKKLLCRVDAHQLIEKGFLTPPHADPSHVDGYDTENLKLNNRGQYNAKDIEQTFEGKGRLTSHIIADIVEKSQGRNGVLIFAATVQHAHEILDSLPTGSKIITGDTKKANREAIIADFKVRRFKYLVNVAVLTVGFDAPHVDVVAILRATESVRLLQQIIGRGLRLCDGKDDCLVLDYAENIKKHCPDGDLFNPTIKTSLPGGGAEIIKAKCPDCGFKNEFSARKNDEEFDIDDFGYFVDLIGERIESEYGDIPAHMGRRCNGATIKNGIVERCGYRWTFKECIECGYENDIAARYCSSCKAELVDPNEKLKLEFTRIKKDPFIPTSDKVLSWTLQEWNTQRGTSLRIDWVTDCRAFSSWFVEYDNTDSKFLKNKWINLCKACGVFNDKPKTARAFIDCFPNRPKTITAFKNQKTGFYDIKGMNENETTEVS